MTRPAQTAGRRSAAAHGAASAVVPPPSVGVRFLVSAETLVGSMSTTERPVGRNAIEAAISRLRRQLAGSGATIQVLRTVGYRLAPTPPQAMDL